MRRPITAICVGVFLMAMALVPVTQDAVAVLEIEKGNYWTYIVDGEVEGMSISMSMTMKVTGTEGTGASAVYLIDLRGSGEISGSYGGFTVSGDIDYSGETKRLVSNFSLVSSEFDMDMSFSMRGEHVDMTLSTLQVCNPALDDFIGDDFPGYGATVVSTSTVTTTTVVQMTILGKTIVDSNSSTEVVTQTIQIASSNQTVVVPAGSFDCCRYTQTIEMMGESATSTFYYSSEVGNYVKTSSTISLMVGLGDGELKSYSYAGRGAGTSSLFSGTNLLLIILAIVAVVVIVVAMIAMRRRGRAQPQMMPPPPQAEVVQQAPPPPPPPPPDQPAP